MGRTLGDERRDRGGQRAKGDRQGGIGFKLFMPVVGQPAGTVGRISSRRSLNHAGRRRFRQ